MSKPTFLAIVALLATVAHVATGFTPAPQYGQAAVVIHDTIFVCGGFRLINSQYVVMSNLYSLNVSQPWNSTNPPWVDLTDSTTNTAIPLSGFYTMWPSTDNESFYVWGGGNHLNQTLPQNGFAQYNVTKRTWSLPSTIANMPQQRRLLSASWTSSGVAYMWGGRGDRFSGYSTNLTAKHAFDDMFTFDTKKLVWNVLNVIGQKPAPRDAYTVTMLSNGQMVFIGGRNMQPASETYFTQNYAQMNSIPIFDTNSVTWKQIYAGGTIPDARILHTAVLGTDAISIIICCGENDTYVFNDVAVLDTQNWYWTKQEVDGNANAPSPRWGLSSVIVNGLMIIFFGIKSMPSDNVKIFNDVSILDTRTKPFKWIASFSPPSPPTSTDIPNGSPGLITIIVVVGGVLVVVIAILIFLFIRKPWRKHSRTESQQGPDAASQSALPPYASNMNHIQPAHSQFLLPVYPQVQATNAGVPLPVQSKVEATASHMPFVQPPQHDYHGQHGYHGQPGQDGYMNYQIQQAASYSTPSGSVMPLQYDYGGQPGRHGHTDHQIQPAVPYSASPGPVMPPIPPPHYSYKNLHAQDEYTDYPNSNNGHANKPDEPGQTVPIAAPARN